MNKEIEKYRKMSIEQLHKSIVELKRELLKSYGISGMAKVKSNKGETKRGGSNLSKRIKREIARINTIIKEKEK